MFFFQELVIYYYFFFVFLFELVIFYLMKSNKLIKHHIALIDVYSVINKNTCK